MATAKKGGAAGAANQADQADKPEAAPTALYTVLSPLNHDQVPYALGEVVELTKAQAAPLLALQAVKPAPAG